MTSFLWVDLLWRIVLALWRLRVRRAMTSYFCGGFALVDCADLIGFVHQVRNDEFFIGFVHQVRNDVLGLFFV